MADMAGIPINIKRNIGKPKTNEKTSFHSAIYAKSIKSILLTIGMVARIYEVLKNTLVPHRLLKQAIPTKIVEKANGNISLKTGLPQFSSIVSIK